MLATVFCVVYAACRPQEGKWQTLAELTDSFGGRSVVAQEHYDWVEGWQVAFLRVETNGTVYGFYLTNESDRWRNVHATESDGIVRVYKHDEVVGLFVISQGTFFNRIQSHTYTKEEGLEGGKNKTARQILYALGVNVQGR